MLVGFVANCFDNGRVRFDCDQAGFEFVATGYTCCLIRLG